MILKKKEDVVEMVELPQAFKLKYQALLGDEYTDFIAAFEQPIAKAFRINPLKASAVLYDTSITGKVPWGAWGYFGQVKGHSVDHTSGVIYSQEPSAQLVADIAHPNPGERVLDLSAAPGGKSTHLASFMQQEGLLISNEIFRKRAQILSENMERFGVQNVVVTNHAPEELVPHFEQYFDKIILDAPCSGEGMFRKDPDAIQYWHEEYPSENATRQRQILTETVKMLRPGGELTYSTCTFAPEEDEQIIAWLVKTYPNFTILPIDKPVGVDNGRPEWADGNPDLVKTARLFPHHLQGEGHFIAKLRYDAPEEERTSYKEEKSSITREQAELWEAFRQEMMPDFKPETLVVFGDQVYAAPKGTPKLKGLQVLRVGIHLGTFKKKRFEPALALALAFHPDRFKERYQLTEENWKEYVHGDTFMINNQEAISNGWKLLEFNGNSVGFAKLVNNQMKNFYPKGLRFLVKTDSVTLADDQY